MQHGGDDRHQGGRIVVQFRPLFQAAEAQRIFPETSTPASYCQELCHEIETRSVQVETTASAEASTVARLGTLVEAAAAQRSPLEGAVAKFAKFYTPLVLVAALCIAFLPWAAGHKDHKVRTSASD